MLYLFYFFTNNFIISIKIILSIKNYKILFANMLLSGISIITGLIMNVIGRGISENRRFKYNSVKWLINQFLINNILDFLSGEFWFIF